MEQRETFHWHEIMAKEKLPKFYIDHRKCIDLKVFKTQIAGYKSIFWGYKCPLFWISDNIPYGNS